MVSLPDPGTSVEVEWQFDAPDLEAVEGWLRAQQAQGAMALIPRGGRDQLDIYYDSADWRVFHAGYSLRVRRGERSEATLKSLDRTEDGPARRVEISEQTDADVPRSGEGPVASRLRLILGREELRPLFVVRTHRRTWAVRADNRDVALVTLDDTVIEPDSTASALRRVEVEEALPGGLEVAHPLLRGMQAACGLVRATASKFESGLHEAGLRPGAPDFGATEIDADAPAVVRAYAGLRKQFAEFLVHEPGTRLGDDEEAVHDMRVATRRLRAALRVYAPLTPQLDRYAEEFKWVASVLGAVRDLDVQRASIEGLQGDGIAAEEQAFAPVLAQLEAERAMARMALLEALDSERRDALVAGFGAALREGPPEDAPHQDTRRFARPVLRDRYRKFHRQAHDLGKRSPHSEYHELRIRGKRLRYSLELLEDVYGRALRRVLRPLRGLQELLGELQDLETMDARLRALTVERGPELPPETRVAIGRLLKTHRRRAKEIVAAHPDALVPVTRAFERLEAVLNEHHGSAQEGAGGDAMTPGDASPDAPPADSARQHDDATTDGAPATLRIYLVRHAIAEEREAARWPDDAERPLTQRGVRRFKRIARALRATIEAPQAVFSSPYARAWHTADLLAARGWPAQQVHPSLLPGGDPAELLSALPQSGAVALVGHEPDLGRLASFLLTGDAERLSFDVKKGGVVCLEMDRAAGVVRLVWLAPPSMLRRLS